MLAFLNGPEVIAILVVVLILFGAKKLPELARGMGKSLGEFKKAKQEFEEEIKYGDLQARDEKSATPATPGGMPAAGWPSSSLEASPELSLLFGTAHARTGRHLEGLPWIERALGDQHVADVRFPAGRREGDGLGRRRHERSARLDPASPRAGRADGRILDRGRTHELFSNIDLMQRAYVEPPQVIELSRRLASSVSPAFAQVTDRDAVQWSR